MRVVPVKDLVRPPWDMLVVEMMKGYSVLWVSGFMKDLLALKVAVT